MFCPKCKSEYIEGYTHCKKCDVDLVDELPEEAAVDEEEFLFVPVCIRSVSNHIEAEMIIELLRQNGIPCYREYLEAGEYLRIYMGYSIYGEDIFVDWDDYDAASDLLDDWDVTRETYAEESDRPEETMEPEEPYENTPSYKRRNSAAKFFAIFTVAVYIFVLLYATVKEIQELLLN